MPSAITVNVGEFVIRIARITWAISEETGPTWGLWQDEPRLRFLDLLKSSSFAGGQSYARIKLSTGQPVSDQVAPEDSESVAWLGDRIAVGTRVGTNIVWHFCGYIVSGALLIDDVGESMTYRVAGPEWIWGAEESEGGSRWPVWGQYRRIALADDVYSTNTPGGDETGVVTAYDLWEWFGDAPTVFNPQGRRNMTKDNVVLTPAEYAPPIEGRIFEMMDRVAPNTSDVELSRAWTILQAAKYLVVGYNDTPLTGIKYPADWSNGGINPLDVLREVNVEGLSLYAALSRVVSPGYAFYVDPKPIDEPIGQKWGPFQLNFFSRVGAGTANLVLNARGTAAKDADASVVRVEASRGIGKTVTSIVVVGKQVRNVRLVYWGGRSQQVTTSNPSSPDRKLMLQSGWKKSDESLSTFSDADDVEGAHAISVVTIDKKGVALKTKWLSRYNFNGDQHAKYADVFRRFVWNEAAEFRNNDAEYGAAGTPLTVGWFTPSLDGVVNTLDIVAASEQRFCRRRRPLGNSAFLIDAHFDKFAMRPPTLYIAIAPTATSAEFTNLKWSEVPQTYYTLDPNRAGFWITADDLAQWRPFEKQDRDAPNNIPRDARSFATLLRSGLLRMCLEGTVEFDEPLAQVAGYDGNAGSPFVRQHVVRDEKTFASILDVADDRASPSGGVLYTLDASTRAMEYATALREIAMDQHIPASILTSLSWDEQAVGSVVEGIGGGRTINLSTTSGRGAQIVAVRMDVNAMKWELLTESAALALRDEDRRRYASGTRVSKRREFGV